ncbi:MAG: metallophosphoesterase [Candidatus Cryptobacteroides sp.]
MILFTSDLHFGHRNIIRHCNRPFYYVEEMDEFLIDKWNKKVGKNDTVYVLGDLMFRNEKAPEEYLRRLKGKKYLITGNHDRDWVKKCDLSEWFESVNRLDFISDGKRQMALCHFPMMSWPHMTRCYMVHGHIHNDTTAEYWPLIRNNPLMLNAGVDINGFEPVTFEEMVENNERFKALSMIEVDANENISTG